MSMQGADTPKAPPSKMPQVGTTIFTEMSALASACGALNVAQGSNLGHLVAEVRAVVDPIVARAGCTVSYGGQFEAQQSASRVIAALFVVSMFAVFILLQARRFFRRRRHPYEDDWFVKVRYR